VQCFLEKSPTSDQFNSITFIKNFIRNQKRQILCKKIDLLEKMISQIFQPPDILAFIADIGNQG
jgi:hypothetical protein